MKRISITSLSLVAALAFAIGCSKRTSPATQTMIKAFDATGSEPKAVAAVDKMLTTLGGLEAWAKVKQLRWEMKIQFGDDLRGHFKHAWDRWNGRHRYENMDVASYQKSKASNDPGMIKWVMVMYDLFRKKGYGTWGGKQVDPETRAKLIKAGYNRWEQDTYLLVGPYKLKDPGVKLSYDREVPESFGKCKPKCHRIKVTFDSRIGKDTYFLAINTETNMPDILQREIPLPNSDKKGLLTFSFDNWTTVNGLKFATRYQNLGEKQEIYTVSEIKIGSPDDVLYVAPVR